MLLSRDHFPPLFRSVRDIQVAVQEYCLAPDKVPVSLDDLRYAFEQVYGRKISFYLVPLHSDILRGIIHIYEDVSKIFVDVGLNSSWSRYVVAKEMCQHITRDEEYRTGDPTRIIEFTVQDGAAPHTVEVPPDIASEDLSRVAAIELLFPFSLREAAAERINNEEETVFTTAEWLDIPEHLVELALSDWYQEFSAEVWAEVNGE